MTTISSVSASNVYGYNAPASSTAGGAPASSSSSIGGVIASFGSTSSAPLTYNAAGLITSQPAATHVTAQAAQADYLAAESAMNQALASLMLSSSSNSTSTSSSTADIFGLNSSVNNPPGLLNSLLSPASTSTPASASTSTSSTATTAQSAYLSAQNAVSQALSSLTA